MLIPDERRENSPPASVSPRATRRAEEDCLERVCQRRGVRAPLRPRRRKLLRRWSVSTSWSRQVPQYCEPCLAQANGFEFTGARMRVRCDEGLGCGSPTVRQGRLGPAQARALLERSDDSVGRAPQCVPLERVTQGVGRAECTPAGRGRELQIGTSQRETRHAGRRLPWRAASPTWARAEPGAPRTLPNKMTPRSDAGSALCRDASPRYTHEAVLLWYRAGRKTTANTHNLTISNSPARACASGAMRG